MNRLSFQDQVRILHMLCEGNSIRSITRLTGIHRTTILNLLVYAGEKCRDFLELRMRNLPLEDVECDEIWTFLLKKQRRIRVYESDEGIGDQYLFVVIDMDTKLVPSFVEGKRTFDVAEAFLMDLRSRLVLPYFPSNPNKPQISTDGLNHYRNAIPFIFEGKVEHGVLIMHYRNAEQPGRYGPPEMIGAERIPQCPTLDLKAICTSHVERNNLTIRKFMRRFARLSLGFSKKLSNLAAAVAPHFAHYNFCRLHGSLPGTPAMAARLAAHPWTMEELMGNL